MSAVAALLVASSAAILLFLGLIHLLYTYSGSKLMPGDLDLQARMREVPLVISGETSVWRAWVGFNASHSFGVILFGAVYGYLSLAERAFLGRSVFLLSLGLVFLGGYVFLAKRYWFNTPFRGVLLALILYVIAIIVHYLGHLTG